MSRKLHPLDTKIIKLMQEKRGLLKKEAQTLLKQEVYKLSFEEVNKVKVYAEHFGLSSQTQLLNEIHDLRREALVAQLSA